MTKCVYIPKAHIIQSEELAAYSRDTGLDNWQAVYLAEDYAALHKGFVESCEKTRLIFEAYNDLLAKHEQVCKVIERYASGYDLDNMPIIDDVVTDECKQLMGLLKDSQ